MGRAVFPSKWGVLETDLGRAKQHQTPPMSLTWVPLGRIDSPPWAGLFIVTTILLQNTVAGMGASPPLDADNNQSKMDYMLEVSQASSIHKTDRISLYNLGPVTKKRVWEVLWEVLPSPQLIVIKKVIRIFVPGHGYRFDLRVNCSDLYRVYTLLHRRRKTYHYNIKIRQPYGSYRTAHPSPPILPSSPPKGLRHQIGTYNINGFAAKKTELCFLLRGQKPSVLCLQETLHRDHQWPLRLPGYMVHHSPWVGGSQRGLALCISNSYASRTVPGIPGFLQMAKAYGFHDNSTWLFGSLYVPAVKHLSGDRRMVLAQLKILLAKYCTEDIPICIGGDWNMRLTHVKRLIRKWGLPLELIPITGSPLTRVTGRTSSDIDHLLVNWQASSCVGPARVRRWHDLSDHWPVFAPLRPSNVSSLPITPAAPRIRKNHIINFKDPIIHHNYWAPLESLTITDSDSLNQLCTQFTSTAKAVLRDQDLYTAQADRKAYNLPGKVQRALRAKAKAYQQWHTAAHVGRPSKSSRTGKAYYRAKKKAQRLLKAHRRESWAQFITKGCTHFINHNGKEGWNWLNGLCTPPRTRSTVAPVKAADGELLVDPPSILSRWREHYAALASDVTGNSRDPSKWNLPPSPLSFDLRAVNDPLQWWELLLAIKEMKNGKASGPDDLPIELYKLLTFPEITPGESRDTVPQPTSAFARICWKIWQGSWTSNVIPSLWQDATVVTIPKPGDPTDTDNSRGISLIPIGLKVISKVVINRLYQRLEAQGFFHQGQAGFRSREECTAQVIALRTIIQNRRSYDRPTYAAFIDIRKAYDTVPTEALFAKLRHIGLTGTAYHWLYSLYASAQASVRVGDSTTEPFPLNRGVRQGCPMSPTLFNIFINDILDGCLQTGAACGPARYPGLLFADDLVVLADSPTDLQTSLDKISEWATFNEMSFGISKCGAMAFNHQTIDDLCFTLQGAALPNVDQYKYLGVPFCPSLSLTPWIEAKQRQAQYHLHRIGPVLRNKSIPISPKLLLLRTQVESRLCYGIAILGSSPSHTTRLSPILSKGLKMIAGTLSHNRIFAALPLHLELCVPPLAITAALALAKGWAKFHLLRTSISFLLTTNKTKNSGPRPWGKLARQFLKRHGLPLSYPQGYLPKESRLHIKDALSKQLARASPSLSLTHYNKYLFLSSQSYLRLTNWYPQYSIGFVWILRLRLRAAWTGTRAAKMGLIASCYKNHCVSCMAPSRADTDDELEHLLIHCTKYEKIRNSTGLNALVAKLKHDYPAWIQDSLIHPILLGGVARGMSLGPSWRKASPHRRDTFGDSEPLVIIVATFLQEVGPIYQSDIWVNQTPSSSAALQPTMISD